MRRAVTLVVAFLLVSPCAYAETSRDALVAEVLANNPSVKARASAREAYRHEAAAAGKWPDPQAAFMVDRFPDQAMPMFRYQVSQMVPWPGKLGLMRDAATRQGEAADAGVEVRRLDLVLEVKRALAMLRLNARRRAVNRASRAVATTIANAALGRYSAGMGSHHEVSRTQVEINALDIELVSLEGERSAMVAMLNALRNAAPDAPIDDPPEVTMTVSDQPLPTHLERAIANRPELRGMAAMQGEMVAMSDLAKRETYPDFMGSIWLNQMSGNPVAIGGMLAVSVPVFGVSRQRERAAAFDARALGASQDEAAMRAMIRYEVSAALSRAQTAARQRDLVAHVALPRARESFQTSLAGFGSGTVDIVGVLDARRALQATEVALAEADAALEAGLAELDRAIGVMPGKSP